MRTSELQYPKQADDQVHCPTAIQLINRESERQGCSRQNVRNLTQIERVDPVHDDKTSVQQERVRSSVSREVIENGQEDRSILFFRGGTIETIRTTNTSYR